VSDVIKFQRSIISIFENDNYYQRQQSACIISTQRFCGHIHHAKLVTDSGIIVQRKIILVLVHYQTAVSHRISSVLRECSYINSATLRRFFQRCLSCMQTLLSRHLNIALRRPE